MSVLGGGGDEEHKLAASGGRSNQQLAAANGSFEPFFQVEAFDWPTSSPPPSFSTQQMLGNNGDQQQQQQHKRRGSSSLRCLTSVPFVKKTRMDWGGIWDKSKEWIRNPLNMALFVWIIAVGVSGAILFMVMTGMLKRALPSKSQRDTWFEVNNQILNALFTLMCLYQHPRRFYHLALLWRWRAGDTLQLRQEYCKDGTCKPEERKHMAVVILLLHLNCFAQYALCGLNLGYPRPRRPPVGVGLTISVAICAPAVAGLYNNLSPLGKDYYEQADIESPPLQQQLQRKTTLEKRYCFVSPTVRQGGAGGGGQGQEARAHDHEWVGGLFDLLDDDISLAYLSVFCSCCVFGWNMSRLGLGNMYVHVVTFVLFCLAPFFIFNLAAVNIDNEAVRDALGVGGVLLCVLGLLYGGFWRIQMRRRFGLPANRACCGKPDLTDCFQWLCCYPCSLAQEVRTADAYDLVLQQQQQPQQQQQHHNNIGSSQMHHHPTLQDELSTMQQPLRFAGVFADPSSSPPPGVATSSAVPLNDDGRPTVPPSVSVIVHKH